ncbi:RAMP superfamily CRISPR-associated protein (plasmid) [Tistrella mobilis]|uniref:RAMP superfamily CRISPR-associated protein n=1 Tax=Tistrella mobilis TaxID=171437 RepID=UPI0035580E9A
MSDAFRPSDVITARFELSAPMFSGQEGDKGSAEIRPTEIKAALRFWWRALAWGRGVRTPQALKEQEDALFGAAADEGRNGAGGRGQGAFLLRVRGSLSRGDFIATGTPLHDIATRHNIRGDMKGFCHVAYGLLSQKREPATIKPALAHGVCFEVDIIPRKGLDDDVKRELVRALFAFGLLGGIGSRMRRGFGSVVLTEITGQGYFNVPATKSEYISIISKIIGVVKTSEVPQWSAFFADENGHGAISGLMQRTFLSPINLINFFGQQLQAYRTHSVPKELQGNRLIVRRAAFGLPQKMDEAINISVRDRNNRRTQGRRASPIMLHIHKLYDDNDDIYRYYGVISIIPSLFLPNGLYVSLFSEGDWIRGYNFESTYISINDLRGFLGIAVSREKDYQIKIESGDLILNGGPRHV